MSERTSDDDVKGAAESVRPEAGEAGTGAAVDQAAAAPAGGGADAPPPGPKPWTVEGQPEVASRATVVRAIPDFILVVVANALAIWAAIAGSWTVLAVVFACVIDGAADGLFAWLRARASWRAGTTEDSRDRVLVKEFQRTYFVIMLVMALVAFMVFTGKLLRPGGEVPVDPGGPFNTWQFWVVAGAFVALRGAIYVWDFVLGREAEFLPPAAMVSEPLRRLFVLQFGVLIAALVIFWKLDSAVGWLVAVLVAKTVADVVLALLERLRSARIRAAVAAGLEPEPRPKREPPRPGPRMSPRGGRRRKRRR